MILKYESGGSMNRRQFPVYILNSATFYFILFYFILFYFILFYFILFYFILFYFILFYFTFCASMNAEAEGQRKSYTCLGLNTCVKETNGCET